MTMRATILSLTVALCLSGTAFAQADIGAYNRALRRFLLATCGLPDVRCVSYRELVDWLDTHRTYPS